MNLIKRRALLKHLLAIPAMPFLRDLAKAAARFDPQTTSATRKRSPNTAAVPLEVFIYGSFAIVVDKSSIRLFTPDIPDTPQGVGHYYAIGSVHGNDNFLLDDDETQIYAYDGIVGKSTPPTFEAGGSGANFDPTKNPVLTNLTPQKYRFLVTLPFPDTIDGAGPPIKKNGAGFFVKPSTLNPDQVFLIQKFTYNSYDPTKLAFHNHHLSPSGSPAQIFIVSHPRDPDRATKQCSASIQGDLTHPQAAMKALGDMLGVELFLNQKYCGATSLTEKNLNSLGLRIPSISKSMLSRLPACMPLLVNNT